MTAWAQSGYLSEVRSKSLVPKRTPSLLSWSVAFHGAGVQPDRDAGHPTADCNAHLADQPAHFQWHRWPAATRSRLPTPERSETGAMPADNGVRLHDRQRIANFREQPIETNEYQLVDGTEGEFLWSSSPQNVYLLPQRPNLCLKRCPRPKQIDNRPDNEPDKISHYRAASPDSRSTASQ